MRPPPSIIAVAVVQLIVSLPCLFVSGGTLWAVGASHRLYPHQGLPPGFFAVTSVLPFCFSLLGVATSIGLLCLQEWARKAAIFLATVPVLGCAMLVLLRPAFVLSPREPNEQNPLLLGILIYLLVILVPISAWWLILLTRASVKGQFQEK